MGDEEMPQNAETEWQESFEERAKFLIRCSIGEIENLNTRVEALENTFAVKGPETEHAKLAVVDAGGAYRAELAKENQLRRQLLEVSQKELEN